MRTFELPPEAVGRTLMRSTQSALWLTVKGCPHVPDVGLSQWPSRRVEAHSHPLTQEMSASDELTQCTLWMASLMTSGFTRTG